MPAAAVRQLNRLQHGIIVFRPDWHIYTMPVTFCKQLQSPLNSISSCLGGIGPASRPGNFCQMFRQDFWWH